MSEDDAIRTIEGVNSTRAIADNQFSPEKIEQCRAAFATSDLEGTGWASTKQMNTLMRAVGLSPTGRELLDMIVQVDPQNTGQMNFNQFLSAVASKIIKDFSTGEIDDAQIQKAFHIFDKDSNGFLSPDEVRHVLTEWGAQVDEEAVRKLMFEADINGKKNQY